MRKRQLFYRVIAFLLAFLMTVSSESIIVMAETVSDNDVDVEETVLPEEAVNYDTDMDYEIESTDSFGEIFASLLEEKSGEQEENNGYNIFSIEMDGTNAKVDFETQEDCTLVVGVYDESGKKLLASGYADVKKEEESATVEISSGTVPTYFYLRAYLVQNGTLRPLCSVFESSIYTESMQELLHSTIANYDADRILNLDASADNNFAVYSEDTIIIKENETTTRLVSSDDSEQIYHFENADSAMLSLGEGDVISFEQENGNVLIVKVGDITIDETDVTIQGNTTEIDEAFDYVKIDDSATDEDAIVDTSQMPEGVVYEGLVEDEGLYTENVETAQSVPSVNTEGFMESESLKGAGLEVGLKQKIIFNLDNSSAESKNGIIEGKGSVNGTLNVGIKVGVKMLVSLKEIYIELKIDSDIGFTFNASGSVKANIPICTGLRYDLCKNVYVNMSPTFVIQIGGELSYSGKLTGTVGAGYSTAAGFINLTKTPKIDSSAKLEVTVFVGLSLEPEAKITDACQVSLKAEAGIELKATLMPQDNEHHECFVCFDGDIYGRGTVGVKIKKSKKVDIDHSISLKTGNIADFYYSVDFHEFGVGTCPHIKREVQFIVVDKQGKPIKDVEVSIDGDIFKTDKSGKTSEIYLKGGSYLARVSKSGYKWENEIIQVKDRDVRRKVILEKGDLDKDNNLFSDYIVEKNKELFGKLSMSKGAGGSSSSAAISKDGSLYLWGDTGLLEKHRVNLPTKFMECIKMISLGESHSALITEDGDLYTWGMNYRGELGTGSLESSFKPVKIMENVVSVSLGNWYSAAITADGSLYTWGRNDCGQLGDGTTDDKDVPIKIMDNVAEVSLGGYHSAAIMRNGDLYIWGNNLRYQLGYESDEGFEDTPEKIMENVASVSLGCVHSAAVTRDGNLYTWGDSSNGKLGTGKDSYGSNGISAHSPTKIMENIASVSLGCEHSSAITMNGELYTWGSNWFGELGDGTSGNANNKYVPKKIMDNMVAVCLGEHHSAAVAMDGSLYMWGSNEYGELGNGTEDGTGGNYDDVFAHSVPEKVSIPPLVGEISLNQKLNNFEEMESYKSIGVECAENIFGDNIENVYSTDNLIEINLSAAGITESSHANIFSGKGNFTGLLPNEIYNYYIMKSVKPTDLFAEDNLLYIGQGISDESGNLNFDYEMKEDYAFPYAFAVGMTAPDISDASVKIDNLTYDGTEQYPNPIVTWKGTTLKEGRDYYLSDDVTAKEVGSYTITVEGTGMYTGSVSSAYQVVKGNTGSVNPSTDASNKPAVVKVSSLSVTGISKKIAAGKSVQLTAEISPADATNKSVTWTSSNTKFATVNASGKVSVKKAGAGKSVVITAKVNDGSGVTATYKISIMKDAVKSIKLSAANKTVSAGKSIKIKATVKTTGKKVNKVLKWTSSNTDYATVNKSGKVKTTKAGKGKTVTITAQATDGSGKKAKIKIKIK